MAACGRENLLRGAATLLSWLKPITDVLPGMAAGSVAAALGAAPVSKGGTPGVVANLHGTSAVALTLGWAFAGNHWAGFMLVMNHL